MVIGEVLQGADARGLSVRGLAGEVAPGEVLGQLLQREMVLGSLCRGGRRHTSTKKWFISPVVTYLEKVSGSSVHL